MNLTVDESAFKSEHDVINKLLEQACPKQALFTLFFNSAIWCSQIRVLDKAGLSPYEIPKNEREDPRFQSFHEKSYYFQRCHLLNDAVEKIGLICRDQGFSPSANAFFSLLDDRCQSQLLTAYDFRRRVDIEFCTLKDFAHYITRENHICANGYELWPAECDEQTDDYGQPTWERTWQLTYGKEEGDQVEVEIEYIHRMERCSIQQAYEKMFGVHPIVDKSTQDVLNGFMTWAERYQEAQAL